MESNTFKFRIPINYESIKYLKKLDRFDMYMEYEGCTDYTAVIINECIKFNDRDTVVLNVLGDKELNTRDFISLIDLKSSTDSALVKVYAVVDAINIIDSGFFVSASALNNKRCVIVKIDNTYKIVENGVTIETQSNKEINNILLRNSDNLIIKVSDINDMILLLGDYECRSMLNMIKDAIGAKFINVIGRNSIYISFEDSSKDMIVYNKRIYKATEL